MEIKSYKGKNYKIEYSIVNVSELEEKLRIDAEYYDPFWLKLEKKIEKLNNKYLGDIATNKYKTFNNKICNYFYYIEIANVDLETGDYVIEKIPCFLAPSRAKKIVEKDDILISTVRPNRNAVAFIFELNKRPLVASTGFCKLHIVDKRVKPYYIFVLFKTYYYKGFLTRKTTATMYPAVSEEDIMKLKIPIPSSTFQTFIEKLVLKAYEERQKAKQLYNEAEEILLNELGLKNWKPKTKKIKIGGIEFEEEENISIKMLSEVLQVDRLDAEYWEPKYKEIENKINNYPYGWGYLPSLVEISKEKIKVDENEIYTYIELADVNPNLGVVNKTKALRGVELPSRARMKVNKDYVIMSSVEGSIEKIALIDFEEKNLVASTGFFVFKEKSKSLINKETLLVLLRILAKRYILREAQGTILTAIPYDSLKRIKIPKVQPRIQQRISQLIQQSFGARKKSKNLLNIAKKAVEVYIEEDERKAKVYAQNELKKY